MRRVFCKNAAKLVVFLYVYKMRPVWRGRPEMLAVSAFRGFCGFGAALLRLVFASVVVAYAIAFVVAYMVALILSWRFRFSAGVYMLVGWIRLPAAALTV